MTFANRNQAGTRMYARSLLNALRDKEGVTAWMVSGPRKSGIARTMSWLLRGARRELRGRPPDILHCPSYVVPWRVTVPFVVTVHDAAARRYPHDHPLEWRFYDRRLMPPRLAAAARVIAVSEFTRKEAIDVYGLNPERVVVVHNGVREVSTSETPADQASGPILFPGAPLGRKNLDVVLRVMTGSPDLKLQISGATAAHFPQYARMIASLRLESRVAWLGQVPDLAAVMRQAALVVYPSLYEGFGFPPLESMAAGTPVVASNRGSLPEVLGDAALLVDPEDDRAVARAIESVMTRPELRDRLRQAGFAQARKYTWEACAERTLDVYRDVLDEHRVAV